MTSPGTTAAPSSSVPGTSARPGWQRKARSPATSSPRGTAMVTARTPRPRPQATTACALTSTGATSARSPGWPRRPRSRSTRRCGQPARGAADGYISGLVVGRSTTAVADGVDVINYSVGDEHRHRSTRSSWPSWPPPPRASSSPPPAATAARARTRIDHTSPWITTVAASTLQPYEGTVTLGNGHQLRRASSTAVPRGGPGAARRRRKLAAAAPTGDDALCCDSRQSRPGQGRRARS